MTVLRSGPPVKKIEKLEKTYSTKVIQSRKDLEQLVSYCICICISNILCSGNSSTHIFLF